MNQILFIKNSSVCNSNHKHKKIYSFILYFSIIICILILFNHLYSLLTILNQSKETNILKHKYIINSLYTSNNNYNNLKISNNISIIGSIDIPKINISYPIIENASESLLKNSVCRFSGPLPNRLGNLCIAGHNYKNNLMFSKLYKLDLGDTIFITDLNNTKLEYIIYDKFKVKENNLDCTKNTSNVEITLITCNSNNNSQRIIIKAKMKG